MAWPKGFARLPDEDWARSPLEDLALKYDTVENHGWYHNLDPTVDELAGSLKDGEILVDYSGGTGILTDRLLRRVESRPIGIAIVDSSPKFLRLALEKFKGEERVAFRHIRYLKEARRLQFLDEVFPIPADALASTNAVHLYYDLVDTLRSWTRVLRPGGGVYIQSGNIDNPAKRPGEWIIDATVEAIHRAAVEIVSGDSRYRAYRPVLDDPTRMGRYEELRHKFFLPVRPLGYYLGALQEAGIAVHGVRTETIEARVEDWYRFLSVYHEGVLGWVGGSERIEGRAPETAAIEDRLALIRRAMERIFEGRDSFPCCWTYLTCASTRSASGTSRCSA